MKKIFTLIAVVVMIAATSISAQAQFHFGIKAGTAINSLKFNDIKSFGSNFSTDNRAGFTGGIMGEFEVPVIGICFDVSAMYVHRGNGKISLSDTEILNTNRDYIDIPVNLKYKFGLPIVGQVVRPYLLTGPAFAFLMNKQAATNAYKNKAFDFSWNFGAGIEFFRHVQLQASYGLGLSKIVGKGDSAIDGKNRYWTVTAAYLF